MKLSLKMIAERLEQQHVLKFKDMFSKMRLGRPVFLTTETHLQPDTLYLAAFDQLPEKLQWAEGAAFILQGPENTDILQYPAVILVDPQMHLLVLHNQISRIFDQYDSWEQDLNVLKFSVQSPKALKQCLKSSRELLDNPIAIWDSEGHHLASDASADFGMETQVSAVAESGFTYEALNPSTYAAKESTRIRQLTAETEVFILSFPAEQQNRRVMVRNIFSGKEVKYRLTVTEKDRPFRETDYLLLEIFAETFSQMIRQRQRAEKDPSQALGVFLQDMLLGKPNQMGALRRELTRLGWKEQGHYVALSSTAPGTGSLLDLFLDYPQKLQEELEGSIAFRLQDHIIFLLNLDVFSGDEGANVSAPSQSVSVLQDLALERISDFAKKQELILGLSNVFQNISDFPLYFHEAEIACEYRLKKEAGSPVLSFRECALQQIIQEASIRIPKADLLSPVYVRLKEHDRQNHTEYLKTLEEYLKQNMNAVQTAAALYMHRATIIYRIKRICEIGQTDLKEPDELLHLALSFKLDS